MLSKDFIQVKIPETKLSETQILELLGKAQKVDKTKIVNMLKQSVNILDSEIKQQAIKYVKTQKNSQKISQGGLNKRKKSLKKSYRT